MKFADCFGRFCNDKVEVYENDTKASEIDADIQPISADLKNNSYGLYKQEVMSMFFSENDIIKAGSRLKYNGKNYITESVFSDELGMKAIIRRCGGYEN